VRNVLAPAMVTAGERRSVGGGMMEQVQKSYPFVNRGTFEWCFCYSYDQLQKSSQQLTNLCLKLRE